MKIEIDPRYCKGCLLCLGVCRYDVLKVATTIGPTGYYPAEVVAAERCTGCAMCHMVCPDAAITIEKEIKAK